MAWPLYTAVGGITPEALDQHTVYLGFPHHITDPDPFRIEFQLYPTPLAARGLHIALFHQKQDDFHEMVFGYAIGFRNITDCRPLAVTHTDIDQNA